MFTRSLTVPASCTLDFELLRKCVSFCLQHTNSEVRISFECSNDEQIQHRVKELQEVSEDWFFAKVVIRLEISSNSYKENKSIRFNFRNNSSPSESYSGDIPDYNFEKNVLDTLHQNETPYVLLYKRELLISSSVSALLMFVFSFYLENMNRIFNKVFDANFSDLGLFFIVLLIMFSFVAFLEGIRNRVLPRIKIQFGRGKNIYEERWNVAKFIVTHIIAFLLGILSSKVGG